MYTTNFAVVLEQLYSEGIVSFPFLTEEELVGWNNYFKEKPFLKMYPEGDKKRRIEVRVRTSSEGHTLTALAESIRIPLLSAAPKKCFKLKKFDGFNIVYARKTLREQELNNRPAFQEPSYCVNVIAKIVISGHAKLFSCDAKGNHSTEIAYTPGYCVLIKGAGFTKNCTLPYYHIEMEHDEQLIVVCRQTICGTKVTVNNSQDIRKFFF